MKKLFALLLALCMLCGVVSAGAEDATQEVELYGSRFRIPAELEITESMSGFGSTPGYLNAWCGTYELVLYARDYAIMGFDLEEDPAFEQILNVVYWYTDMGLDANQAATVAIAHELQDIEMPDGKQIACLEIGENISIGHTDNNYGFLIMLTSYTGQNTAELVEIGKQIALSFRRDGAEEFTAEVAEPDEPMTEATEVKEEKQAAEAPTQYVVITGESANIRKGATTDAPVITSGRRGDTFPYLGESGNWYKIDANGETGYVSMGLSDIK